MKHTIIQIMLMIFLNMELWALAPVDSGHLWRQSLTHESDPEQSIKITSKLMALPLKVQKYYENLITWGRPMSAILEILNTPPKTVTGLPVKKALIIPFFRQVTKWIGDHPGTDKKLFSRLPEMPRVFWFDFDDAHRLSSIDGEYERETHRIFLNQRYKPHIDHHTLRHELLHALSTGFPSRIINEAFTEYFALIISNSYTKTSNTTEYNVELASILAQKLGKDAALEAYISGKFEIFEPILGSEILRVLVAMNPYPESWVKTAQLIQLTLSLELDIRDYLPVFKEVLELEKNIAVLKERHLQLSLRSQIDELLDGHIRVMDNCLQYNRRHQGHLSYA